MKIFAISTGILLMSLCICGCINNNNNDNNNNEYITKGMSVYFVINTNFQSSEKQLDYIILPTLIYQNNTIDDIDNIWYEKILFDTKEYIYNFNYTIEETIYGIGMNITPIPNEIRILYKNVEEQHFNKNDLQISEQFHSNNLGLSLWLEENNQFCTYIYSSTTISDNWGFELIRWPCENEIPSEMVRDINKQDFNILNKGWNKIELEREISIVPEED